MFKLDKEDLRDIMVSHATCQLNSLMESVSKSLLKPESEYRVFNWETNEYLGEAVYATKEEAAAAIVETENPSSFLVVPAKGE